MKKLSFIALAFAALAFTSCKKTENAAPVITLTNITSPVTATSATYSIPYVITSEAGLSKVVISEKRGTTTTPKQTISSFSDNAKYTDTYSVVDITADVTVTFAATDKDDQTTTTELIIKAPSIAGGAINTLAARTIGTGGVNSYFDVEANQDYNFGTAKVEPVKSAIDFIYDSNALYNSTTAVGSLWASGTGATFAETSISTTAFDAATDDALFASISTSLSTVAAGPNKVIAFSLKSGKKGLMKITAYTAAAVGIDGSITFVIKVQQ